MQIWPRRTPRSNCVLDTGQIAIQAAGIAMTEVHAAVEQRVAGSGKRNKMEADRTLLVTGGAGIHRLELHPAHPGGGRRNARVVNLDKLTYAGNQATVADLANAPATTRFVHGDIADDKLVAEIFSSNTAPCGGGAFCGGKSRGPVHR